MITIMLTQWTKLRRAPIWFLAMLFMTFMFTLILGGQSSSKLELPVILDSSMDKANSELWLERLNDSEVYAFRVREEEDALTMVREGQAELAVRLFDEDYRIIAAADNPNVNLVEQHIHSQFLEELRIRQAALNAEDPQAFRSEVEQKLLNPALGTTIQSIESEVNFRYNEQLQFLFGFTLFFVIYSIAYSVIAIMEEKQSGIWDRIILSPTSKTEMYLGHLVYSFLVGCAHIGLMFVVFHYIFGFDLGEQYGMIILTSVIYVLSIVALCIMLVSLIKTSQQYSAIIPLVAVSMAMLGGAYWPIELVSNSIVTATSKFIPLTYGMEALKGITLYQYGWTELLKPLGVLALMSVMFMGIGINLMERRLR
ncbi:ABC transporter permease [Paenibacillus senegalensis]|uniref:ABC transporter permease n=1 Tax=Paenibacillus senegalensis TaxID=1465766 RepID=UPI000289A7A6|nr:ABC transporter permease [Paenibacillus senegalensis]